VSDVVDDGLRLGWSVASETGDTVKVVKNERSMLIKRLDMADTMDVIEAAGFASSNEAWMRMAIAICSVREIDGLVVPIPTTKEAIKNAVRKMGDELAAVTVWVLWQRPASAPNDAEAVATAKN
jgi:hypothetical protein